MKTIDIEIGNKEFTVKVASTDEEKTEGLSTTEKLPKDEGMLFVYEEPEQWLIYTMRNTSLDLDIIFIDKDKKVISVNTVEAYDKKPIICSEYAQYVLEVNANSGIQEGDELDISELTEEEQEIVKKSKMLVLDENGDVQMKLFGGERIISRIKTRQIVKQAIRAYKSDNDDEYIKLGKMVFKELDAQDSRPAEYVEAPESSQNE